jgi:hypothetical protein
MTGCTLSIPGTTFSQAAVSSIVETCKSARNPSEATAIQRANGKASRDGCTLIVRAGDNEARLIDDLREGGSYVRYEYRSVLPDTEFHVVAIFFYEGTAFEIVGPRGKARLAGAPVVSPDHRRVLSVSKDLYAGFNPNAVEIWNIEKGFPRLELSLRSDEWGPDNARWVNAQTVEFGQTSLNEKDLEQERKGAHLHYSEGGWSFTPADK